MKHFGDITKINGAEVPMVDIICGGSPCQDLSVAGKRAGLKHSDKGDEETTRSGLFMEQIRIVKEMRDECARQLRMRRADDDIRFLKPRFMVWENVPGAFSSNKGEDFRCVLEEICRVADQTAIVPLPEKGKWSTSGCIVGDGWSVAWRVHDAQFWGVPQRRKRISLVADFGSESAGKILFESESVSGDSEQSREERKGITSDSKGSTCETIGVDSYNLTTTGNVSKTLQAERSDNEHIPCAISFQERAGKPGGGKGILIQNEHTGALSTLNNQSVVYGICSNNSNSMKSSNPFSGIYEADTSRTLDLNGGSPACNQGGMAVVYRKKGHPQNSEQGQGWEQTDTNDTLNAFDNGENRTPTVVVNNYIVESFDNYNLSLSGEIAKTLQSEGGGSGVNEGCVLIENHPTDSRVKICEDNIVPTLASRMGTGGNNVPLVLEKQEEPILLESNQNHATVQTDGNAVIQGINGDVAGTLDANYYKGCGERQGTERDVIAYGIGRASYQKITGTLDCCISKGTSNQLANNDMFVANHSIVRRLTPMECERLQGYPDGWTDIGDWVDSKGKKHKGDADSPRYKALGNSIALPFWEWMAGNMANVLREDGNERPTMASLFDGISGFCLVFKRCGVEPIWSSEIESFPIAVAKKHFGDDDNGVEGDVDKYL